VKGQKLVNRHRFEVIRFHFFLNPDALPPAAGFLLNSFRRLVARYHEWKNTGVQKGTLQGDPTRLPGVSASHFKPKLQDDLLTRPVQQLDGYALDDPEPCTSRQARAAGNMRSLGRTMCSSIAAIRTVITTPNWT